MNWLGDTDKVVSRKSKGLLTEKLTTSTTTDNSLSPLIQWYKNSIQKNPGGADSLSKNVC